MFQIFGNLDIGSTVYLMLQDQNLTVFFGLFDFEKKPLEKQWEPQLSLKHPIENHDADYDNEKEG